MASTQPLKVYKKLITERLPVSYPTINYAAQRVGIPVRTLQRRLRESGLSYSELVEQTRCELACRLLDRPGAKAADVARALGYTDPSSFSRAFRRWTGMSPSAYRNRNQRLSVARRLACNGQKSSTRRTNLDTDRDVHQTKF
jgi:AraC-like DNA-binding protein